MPAPSQLAIATSSLQRLVKEEASYHKELEHQKANIAKLEQGGGNDDENAEYQLKQERKGLEETEAIFPRIRESIKEARAKLEQQLQSGDNSSSEEISRAKEVVAASLATERETH